MKSCALALPVFFVLRYIPFLSTLGAMGFLGLSIGIPVWALRWWLKYGSIEADDAEFLRARKTVKIAGIGASLAFLLGIILPFFVGFFIALSRR
jgi:cadmium resistance protein CadD (predicted permease)